MEARGAPGGYGARSRGALKRISVLEPFQTQDSLEGQIEELLTVCVDHFSLPGVLIGYSWGAMLSLLVAAKKPEYFSKLILIGSGPLEASYAPQIMERRLSRLNPDEQIQLKRAYATMDGEVIASLLLKADLVDPIPHKGVEFQSDLYQKVWPEVDALRKKGGFMEATKRIKCPVIAIHGEADPHPPEGVEEPLGRRVEDFRFILLKGCGHTPWYERQVKGPFFNLLREELCLK